MSDDTVSKFLNDSGKIISEPNSLRSVVILVLSVIVAYWLSKFLALAIIKVAQLISVRADNTSNEDRVIRLRRVETFLSVIIALVRAITVAIVAYITWKALNPDTNGYVAAIGASTVFVVLAGATVGIILRDLTAGATMIIEQWFNVGDFIRVEPFMDVSGVVERVTLRATKLRSLNGEVVWLHNQWMQGVKVTPRGVRTIAVDIFVNDEKKGRELVEQVMSIIPVGTMTIAQRLHISKSEKWYDKLWLITVVGQTAPGREWLIEDFFVESLKDLDAKSTEKILVRKPLARYADPAAERSFKRAVRAAKSAPVSDEDQI